MRKFVICLLGVLLLAGCATSHMKYEPPKIEPPKKLEHYRLPPDPFAKIEPPQAIFLKKQGSVWVECAKEEAILVAYTAREHDKIVLRLGYYKEILPRMEQLINVFIDMNNARIELQVDQQLAKELYKQMWIDVENRRIDEKFWNNLEKAGNWAIIIAQLIAIIAIAF